MLPGTVKWEVAPSRSPSPQTPSPPKKARKTKADASPKTDSKLKDARAMLAEEIVRRGIAAAQADSAAIAAKTGLTAAQVKNQLSPGRSNVRRSLQEAAKNA